MLSSLIRWLTKRRMPSPVMLVVLDTPENKEHSFWCSLIGQRARLLGSDMVDGVLYHHVQMDDSPVPNRHIRASRFGSVYTNP